MDTPLCRVGLLDPDGGIDNIVTVALDIGERAARTAPGLESCTSAPLVDGGTLVGVLTLYAPDRKTFTDDHGRLVQMITPHVAQAIARAQRRQPGDVVAIWGCGPVGLFAIASALMLGAAVLMRAKRPSLDVALGLLALVFLARCALEKFGGDSTSETERNFNTYRQQLREY